MKKLTCLLFLFIAFIACSSDDNYTPKEPTTPKYEVSNLVTDYEYYKTIKGIQYYTFSFEADVTNNTNEEAIGDIILKFCGGGGSSIPVTLGANQTLHIKLTLPSAYPYSNIEGGVKDAYFKPEYIMK